MNYLVSFLYAEASVTIRRSADFQFKYFQRKNFVTKNFSSQFTQIKKRRKNGETKVTFQFLSCYVREFWSINVKRDFGFRDYLPLFNSGPRISKSNLKRESISPEERLCVTLRFLVTGDSQAIITASYRISKATIGRLIKETTEVIWDILIEEGFLTVPGTAENW